MSSSFDQRHRPLAVALGSALVAASCQPRSSTTPPPPPMPASTAPTAATGSSPPPPNEPAVAPKLPSAAPAPTPGGRCHDGLWLADKQAGATAEVGALLRDVTYACLGKHPVDGPELTQLRTALGDELRSGGQPRLCRPGFVTLHLVAADGRWMRPQICPNAVGTAVVQGDVEGRLVNTTLIVHDWQSLSKWLSDPSRLVAPAP